MELDKKSKLNMVTLLTKPQPFVARMTRTDNRYCIAVYRIAGAHCLEIAKCLEYLNHLFIKPQPFSSYRMITV